MRKLLTIILTAVMLFSACGAPAETVKYSENILFSVDFGGAGFGTIADCADAYVYVHTDKTAHIFMINSDYSEIIEIGQIDIPDEQYERLKELSDPEKITKLKATSDQDVCDGVSYYINLYGENDEEIFSVGGYMPKEKAFNETRNELIDILVECGVSEIAEAHRKTLE